MNSAKARRRMERKVREERERRKIEENGEKRNAAGNAMDGWIHSLSEHPISHPHYGCQIEIVS